jgi:hypothetical protein
MQILKVLYVASFAICILPNVPKMKNVSYDEPQNQLSLFEEKINELEEGSCYFSKDETKKVSLQEILQSDQTYHELDSNICLDD